MDQPNSFPVFKFFRSLGKKFPAFGIFPHYLRQKCPLGRGFAPLGFYYSPRKLGSKAPPSGTLLPEMEK